MNESEEIWKVNESFPGYEFSNLGRVRNQKTMRILKATKLSKTGYLSVSLYEKNKRKEINVHRLIALTFLERNR